MMNFKQPQDIDTLSNAYYKYSINQSHGNLRRLQELTGTTNLSAALKVTQGMILRSRRVKSLNSLQQAIGRLRRVNLIQGRALSQEFQQLDHSIKERLLHLEKRDMRKMQTHIFYLCCRALKNKIFQGQSKIIGPNMLNLCSSNEFKQDVNYLCKLPETTVPREKLLFLTQKLVEMQDKYLPGSMVESHLWQFLILCLITAEHPTMLLDLQEAQKGLDPEEGDLQEAHWMKRISVAVANIYEEALPILETHPPADLQNLKASAIFKSRTAR